MTKLAKMRPTEITPEDALAEHLDSWEACVSEWISRKEETTKNQFILGLIASSVEIKFGAKSLDSFAADVGETLDAVYLYREVYRKCFAVWKRFQNLGWSHFAIVAKTALSEADRTEILQLAADGGWKTPQLKREVGLRRVINERGDEVPHLDPQMAAAISHWRELKASVEKFATANPQFTLYAEDFIGDVDEAIETPWESGRAYIDRLIFAGCREVEALAKASHWKPKTVERLCEELVGIGTHEWREQGGKTDEARGARRRLIVPVDEPSGESYQGSRFGMVMGEDDDE